jgi:hypothetical protein
VEDAETRGRADGETGGGGDGERKSFADIAPRLFVEMAIPISKKTHAKQSRRCFDCAIGTFLNWFFVVVSATAQADRSW